MSITEYNGYKIGDKLICIAEDPETAFRKFTKIGSVLTLKAFVDLKSGVVISVEEFDQAKALLLLECFKPRYKVQYSTSLKVSLP
jgi:hypothetical protein